MNVRTDLPQRVETTAHLWIPLRDGTRLSARLWKPAGGEPVPAVFELVPYRKTDVTAVDDSTRHPYVAGHGYAVLRVDIRGSGDSEGLPLDEYHAQEQEDALDVIEWIAAQPWCDGNVGMTGISWSGFNSLQVAARRPPALKAIISACSTDDRYDNDVHYMGGAPLGYYLLPWATAMYTFGARPPDPAVVGERWREMWRARMEANPNLIETWLSHQRRDAYWDQGSVCAGYGAIECPTFLVGGWADAYTDAIFRMLERLDCPCRALIGPWGHMWPQAGVPGPAIGFLQECVRWWDRWLKGVDDGVMEQPTLHAWLQDPAPPDPNATDRPGRWVAWPESTPQTATFWPGAASSSPGASPTSLPGASPTSLPGAGALAAEPPSQPVRLVHRSPLDVGVDAGAWCPYGNPADLPGDQRADDARSLSWTSAPLERDLALLGSARLRLRIAADRPRAFVAARLCDVAPDGRSTMVARGVLNLCHRDGHDRPAELEPRREYDVELTLKATGYRFAAGSRLRLSLSTSLWPWIWPSPELATITVTTGPETCLTLPLHTGEEASVAFGPPEISQPLPVAHVRPRAPGVKVARDLVSGETAYTMLRDFVGAIRFEDGLTYEDDDPITLRIAGDDPLSASVECFRRVRIARDDWNVELRVRTRMDSDARDFTATTAIEAYEGEQLAYSTSHRCRIARDHC